MTQEKHLSRHFPNSPLTRYTRNLLKKINRVIDEHKLISEGDRVCVPVSGGKDSLSLLHLLLEHIRFYPMSYTVGAVHIVSDFAEHREETKAFLESEFRSLGIEYAFIDISVTTDEEGNKADPSCFWCSRKRREALFKHCIDANYKKLAFGHHADDVAETTLLNLFYHGNLDTILPKRVFFDGAFDVIRPLFSVRERALVQFAKLAGFSTTTCTCTHAVHGKRQVMKRLIRDLTKESRQLHSNLWRAARLWREAYGEDTHQRKSRNIKDDKK